MIRPGSRVKILDNFRQYINGDEEAPTPDPGIVFDMIKYIGKIMTVSETFADGTLILREEGRRLYWGSWQVKEINCMVLETE